MRRAEEKEMPRERLQRLGSSSLSNEELLAVLLRTGIQGLPVLRLAENLLARYRGDLRALCDASLEELRTIPGMGLTKSLELMAAFALARRMADQALERRPAMGSPQQAAQLLQGIFIGSQQEEFHALLLDTQLQLLRDHVVSVGLVDRSLIHPREVFRMAIRTSSSNILLCHNHPSGNLTPSANDIEATNRLVDAGEIIGIRIIDHIIVSGNTSSREYFSFREHHLLKQSAPGKGQPTPVSK